MAAAVGLLVSASPVLADHGQPTVCRLTSTPRGWDPSVTTYTVPPNGDADESYFCQDAYTVELDLGGDGIDELLMTLTGVPWMLIVRSDGMGEWRHMGVGVDEMGTADFNGDGRLDLWLTDLDGGGGFKTYLNAEDGTLQNGPIELPAWISETDWSVPAFMDSDLGRDLVDVSVS